MRTRGHGRRHYKGERKKEQKKTASEHISRMMNLATQRAASDSILAERQALMAWNLSTKTTARLGRWRLLFCHKCKKFMVPPDYARYRLSKKRKSLNITCLHCGGTYRFVFDPPT